MSSNKVILRGRESELKPIITQLMALHQLIDDRDIGSWCGYPIDEYFRRSPQSHISIKILFSTFKKPPFYQVGRKWFSRRQVSIPVVDTSKLTYSNIRSICGGSSGQNWGEYKATAVLGEADEPKSIHKLVVGGSSENRAIANLERFLPLTKLKLKGLTVTKEDYSRGYRAQIPDKEKYNNFEVYPAFMLVTNTKIINYIDSQNIGKATTSGRELLKRMKFSLYQDAMPDDWEERLRYVIRKDFDKPI